MFTSRARCSPGGQTTIVGWRGTKVLAVTDTRLDLHKSQQPAVSRSGPAEVGLLLTLLSLSLAVAGAVLIGDWQPPVSVALLSIAVSLAGLSATGLAMPRWERAERGYAAVGFLFPLTVTVTFGFSSLRWLSAPDPLEQFQQRELLAKGRDHAAGHKSREFLIARQARNLFDQGAGDVREFVVRH